MSKMETAEFRSSDVEPVFAGLLFAEGATDTALVEWVAPLQEQLVEDFPGSFLWLWRYGRPERLEVIFHSGRDNADNLRREIEEAAEAFLAQLGPASKDSESEAPERSGPEDRSLHIHKFSHRLPMLGGPPFTDSETYIAAFYRALGAAHGWFLRRIRERGELTAELRDHLMASLVWTSVHRVHEPESRAEYLAYYRDWLLRFPLLKLKATQKQADLWTLKLAKRSAEATEPLTPEESLDDDLWLPAVDRLGEFVSAHRDDPAYDVDPHSRHGLNPPFSKLHLALGNALGFGTMDQALLIHRLLERVSPERASRPVSLREPRDPESA